MAVKFTCDHCMDTADGRHNASGAVILPASTFDKSWVQWTEIDLGIKEFCRFACLEAWRKAKSTTKK